MQCGGDKVHVYLAVAMLNYPGLTRTHTPTPTTSTAPIQVHLCLDEITNKENIGIEHLELFKLSNKDIYSPQFAWYPLNYMHE